MDGNDGRYDKSKPREATDQYSPRQYYLKKRMEVAAPANPMRTRSPKSFDDRTGMGYIEEPWEGTPPTRW